MANLTKMANLTAVMNHAKMANVTKICHGFGEYSNFMPKGVLWRVEMTKILRTFKQYRESTESGKKSPKTRRKFQLDYTKEAPCKVAKLTETANLTKMVNLVGENGKSGLTNVQNWMTK